ncbi:hypothetical protein [Spiroplasma endosymbiont of Polydrusus formosus]|uniref:hypothetical protein n=1 Tax=Spiroplasma endosymbiont of Polydrusus formosus TaxID=3139326 RepID=UPI0035B5024E
MTEYKSLYINKTWNEITISFDWVNGQHFNCRISHHKNHYDLQCLYLSKIYLNLFKNNLDVINYNIKHYKINDILDLAANGWKILEIKKKINQII